MTDLPKTIWLPGIGEGEMSSNGGLFLTTLNGNNIVTKSGDYIITDESTYEELATTQWIKSEGE